jgi:hypothetical protein
VTVEEGLQLVGRMLGLGGGSLGRRFFIELGEFLL